MMKSIGLLFLLVSSLVLIGGCDRTSAGGSNAGTSGTTNGATNGPEASADSVLLEINFGGRAENKSMDVSWADGSTVVSILNQAKTDGAIKVALRGSGKNAFLVSIDDIENEGAGGDNWIYRLNGEVGKVGAGAQRVKSGDEINWTLGAYEFSESDE